MDFFDLVVVQATWLMPQICSFTLFKSLAKNKASKENTAAPTVII